MKLVFQRSMLPSLKPPNLFFAYCRTSPTLLPRGTSAKISSRISLYDRRAEKLKDDRKQPITKSAHAAAPIAQAFLLDLCFGTGKPLEYGGSPSRNAPVESPELTRVSLARKDNNLVARWQSRRL
jgi:hypothetical protein